MKNTWIVVADNAKAIILEHESREAGYYQVNVFENPTARMHERELTSDLPGRTFDSKGMGRHAKENPTSAKQHETVEFARRVSDFIDKARNKHLFDELDIVAAPSFLGIFRDQMSKETQKYVNREIAKDLVHFSPTEIESYLRNAS